MSLPPIVERELRVAFRKQKPAKRRLTLTAGAALFMLVGAMVFPSAQTLHWFLFLYGLLVVLRALHVSASLFAEERRNQTLELLFLTGMTSPQLFITKLMGGVLIASSDLIAIMPFLSIPFLAGGLSLQLFLATLVTLPALLLFVVGVGVLASVICTEDGTAMLAGAVIIAVLCFLTPIPYNLGLTLAGRAPFSPFWLCLSPAYAPWMVGRSFGSTFPVNFWPAIGFTLAWTLVALVTAAVILSRNWRNDPAQNAGFWRQTWQLWVHGSEQWRLALRKRLLSQNPFRWRIEQDRRPSVLAWIIVGGSVSLWGLGWLAWRQDWLTTTNLFAVATIVAIAFYWLELQSVAQQMARERRDGTLELLLTTPMTSTEIVDALLDAPAHQLRAPRYVALVFFVMMMIAGFFVRLWNAAAIATYVMVWIILCWFVIARPRNTLVKIIWVALISGRTAFALYRTHTYSYSWLIVASFNFYRVAVNFGNASIQFPKGTALEVVSVAFVGAIVAVVAFVALEPPELLNTLRAQMHSIAQRPVPDPDDPRFRAWKDIQQPFPAAH
jgi:hypothetical protein